MRIIFTKDKDITSRSVGTESDGNAKVCIALNENDLVERRWFDLDTVINWVNSNKLKLSGTVNAQKAET